MTIGTRYRTWREHIGITQTAVAEKVGWHRQEVSRLEIGDNQPTLARLKLAVEEGLGISLVEFLDNMPSTEGAFTLVEL
jgi:transcriptional regulator with XRE-family HTH domain